MIIQPAAAQAQQIRYTRALRSHEGRCSRFSVRLVRISPAVSPPLRNGAHSH